MEYIDEKRRALLVAAAGGVSVLALPQMVSGYSMPAAAIRALGESPLVYISPLQSSGEESSCHGEVWFFVDGGDVVVGSQTDTWKVRAVNKGLDSARIWVADYGPEWRSLGRYRKAPNFLATASIDEDRAVYDSLMVAFGQRYPDEWDAWEGKFRDQYASGQRVLIRYTPVGA